MRLLYTKSQMTIRNCEISSARYIHRHWLVYGDPVCTQIQHTATLKPFWPTWPFLVRTISIQNLIMLSCAYRNRECKQLFSSPIERHTGITCSPRCFAHSVFYYFFQKKRDGVGAKGAHEIPYEQSTVNILDSHPLSSCSSLCRKVINVVR